MKTLFLLRHAKSGWDDPVARDFDRPVNAKGRRGARMIGRHLRDAGRRFDHVVSSPAVRCVETIEEIVAGYREPLAPAWDRRVYLASAAALLEVVHEAPAAADSVLLIGHNPGMEELALLLVPDRRGDALRDAVEEKFPTSAVAELTFDVAAWGDIAAQGATFASFVRPRDLDPALGPDIE